MNHDIPSRWRLGDPGHTNLEQISDWLTKIIVGIGLVELKNVPGMLERLGRALAVGLDPAAASTTAAEVLGVGLLIYFVVLGFFGGYLLTRVFLTGVFRRADQTLVDVGGNVLTLAEATALQGKLVGDLMQRVAGVEATSPDSGEDSVPARAPLSGKSVLWVDDNPQNNSYVVEQLGELGVQVIQAVSTEEASMLLKKRTFTCVITDMAREEGGRQNATAGIDLVRAVKLTSPDVPAIVHCSTFGARAHAAAARAAGAQDVITSPTRLLAILKRMFGSNVAA